MRIASELLKLQGVAGVSDPAIYVEDKYYAKAVPRFVNGKPVEIKVVGRIRFLHRRRHRPLIGGISIGANGLTGTLTTIDYNGMIVSCTHVIAMLKDGREVDGSRVIQPGTADGGGEVVGYEVRHARIDWNNVHAENYADVAIAKPLVSVRSGYVLDIGKCKGIDEVKRGDVVWTSGRTSGLRKHVVIDTSATVKVYWNRYRWAVFRDCIIFEPPIVPGDSGCPLIKDRKFAGIGFAGSGVIGVACKAKHCTIVNWGEKPAGKPSYVGRFVTAGILGAGVASVGLVMQHD